MKKSHSINFLYCVAIILKFDKFNGTNHVPFDSIDSCRLILYVLWDIMFHITE